MLLGTNVDSTNDGIHIGTHNYWYTTGAFKMGTATNHVKFDGSSTLNVNFDDILINTSTFQVSSSLNSGTIRLGSSVTAITATTNTGVYMDGTGKFRVGESTNGDNFIYFDSNTTQIKSTNFDLPFRPVPVYILNTWFSFVPFNDAAMCCHIYLF